MSDVISDIKKDYLFNLVTKGERADGRAFDEYREITLESGAIEKAEGSAMVKLGSTRVLVGVKIQPGEPFSDTPDRGVIITNAELVPLASPKFEPGPPTQFGIEVARLVDRGIRESGALDLEALCVEPGRKVWIIFIDIHILDDCGNILDAASLGAITALLNAVVPAERYGLGEDYPLEVRDIPLCTTAAEFAGAFMFDPDVDEGDVADTKLTVITTVDGSICGMQKSGAGMLSQDHAYQIAEIACEIGKTIRGKFLDV